MKEALERLLADTESATAAAQNMLDMTTDASPEFFNDPAMIRVALVALFSGQVATKSAIATLLQVMIREYAED